MIGEMRVSILILLLLSSLFAEESEESKTLHKFLWSKFHNDTRSAYSEIISEPEKYKDAILDQLKYYESKPNQIPNSLIYIASYVRDKRYIPFLIRLMENEEYTYTNCIYSCPIIFSLTIYSCFTDFSIPELNRKLSEIDHLYLSIESVKNLVLKSEKASDYIKGPGIDSLLKAGEKLDTPELIQLAGPKNTNGTSRISAAYILHYRLLSPEYLPELYWLAITELLDASCQFRCSIYEAIYNTETQKLNTTHN
jgi:hypothetical protein